MLLAGRQVQQCVRGCVYDHNAGIKILCLSQLLKLLENHRAHTEMGIVHGYAHVFYSVVTAQVGKGGALAVIYLDLCQAFLIVPHKTSCLWSGQTWV